MNIIKITPKFRQRFLYITLFPSQLHDFIFFFPLGRSKNLCLQSVCSSSPSPFLCSYLFDSNTSFSLWRLAEMKFVAAYLLAVLAGNTHPSIDDIKAILGSGIFYTSTH